MKRLGISSIYVVDKGNRLLGAVTAQDAVEAAESGRTLQDVLISDLPMMAVDTLLIDLFDIVSTASIPVAVVDEGKRLQGIIIRGALIGALAGDNQFINNDGIVDSVEETDSEVKSHE